MRIPSKRPACRPSSQEEVDSTLLRTPPSQAEQALGTSRLTEIATALEYAMLAYGNIDATSVALKERGCEAVEPVVARVLGVCGICFRKGERAFIVFRGSNDLQDWFLNMMAVPVGIPFCYPFRHLGFAASWWSVRGQVHSWLQRNWEPNLSLTFSGHSLGGAISQLAAFSLAGDYRVKSVVTFGAPRFAFLGTAARYENTQVSDTEGRSLGDVTQAVVNHRDIVAKLPTWPFREVGELIFIDAGGFVRHGDEAHSKRWRRSIEDINFVFSEQSDQALSSRAHGLQGSQDWSNLSQLAAALIAPFRPLIAPIILYCRFCMQLARAGGDHFLHLYGKVFLPGTEYFVRIRVEESKGAVQRMWEVLTMILLSIAVVGSLGVVGWWLIRNTVLQVF